VERLRAAAATEITTEEVKPIQTDFHFFVREHIDKHRKLAEEEVRNGAAGTEAGAGAGAEAENDNPSRALDPVLVNSNLNTRLMKAWENLSKEKRDAYMIHEETDRRRFMEDDEIASRHCATLTARGKSPRVMGNDTIKALAALQRQKLQQPDSHVKVKREGSEEGQTVGGAAAATDAAAAATPAIAAMPVTTMTVNNATNDREGEEKKTEEPTEKEESKRPGDHGDQLQESPSKKNKVEQ